MKEKIVRDTYYFENLQELPCIRFSKKKVVADMEVENIEVEVKGFSLEEVLAKLKQTKHLFNITEWKGSK